MKINFSEEVSGALHFGKPIVALESTVIAHGLPYPENIETAYKLERIIRENGAVPATIAVFGGEVSVGVSDEQIERLAISNDIRKISRRDLPIACAMKLDCATTVATTSYIARHAGINVFATGGIGGVHRGYASDVSADLIELARTPIVIVCSGAKIVLDLPATREWLETYGVTLLGWQCDEMPAFYSRSSGLPVDQRIEDAKAVSAIARSRDELELTNAILVTVPVPAEFEVEKQELEEILVIALKEANSKGIKGKAVTPFLLSAMAEQSGGRTLKANMALLENNAKIASAIAATI